MDLLKESVKCGIEKQLDEFVDMINCMFGKGHVCKECRREYKKIYHKKHKNSKIEDSLTKKIEKVLYNKQYYKTNKQKRNEYTKKWKSAHKKEISSYNKECWEKQKNGPDREKRLKRRNENYHINKKDSNFILLKRIRSRIRKVIKRGYTKSYHTLELLGCSIEFLKEHLQVTAIKNGYKDFNINNYNTKEFHVDHIIPCVAFNLECSHHQKICFNWTNFQILKAYDNISKNAKVDFSLLEEFKKVA